MNLNLRRQYGQKVRSDPYNRANDPAESKAGAAEHAEILDRLEKIMAQQRVESDLFRSSSLDQPETRAGH